MSFYLRAGAKRSYLSTGYRTTGKVLSLSTVVRVTIKIRTDNIMKDVINEAPEIITGEDEPRFEPFATIVDLADDFGNFDLLQSLQLLAKLESEDKEYCSEYREEQAWLALELTQLIIKWERRSQPPLPMVNSAGSGLLQ
jgi:hypothetical protein